MFRGILSDVRIFSRKIAGNCATLKFTFIGVFAGIERIEIVRIGERD